MDCCCPGDKQPIYGVYVNNFQTTRVSSHKNKFSFRTTAAGSTYNSRISQNSQQPSENQSRDLDEELRQLEREYELLREEEAAIDYFQRNRVRELEDQVAFYEREIRDRTRDIEELHYLFRVRMEERNAQAQRMQFHQQQNQPQQVYFKNPQGNDTTSISSIQPYL